MKEIRVFNRSLHRELWQWLAENPEAAKCEWPGWTKYEIKHSETFFYCFACACAGYTEEWMKDAALDADDAEDTLYERCSHCPLDWDNEGRPCWWDPDEGDGLNADPDVTGLYTDFKDAKVAHRWCDAEDIALTIRDLPVREDPDYITIII